MSKPWDKLRKALKKLPIASGHFFTTRRSASVHVHIDPQWGTCHIAIANFGKPRFNGLDSQEFGPQDLRELAEFCTELADQLEAGG